MDTLPLTSPEQVGLSAARLSHITRWMRGWVDSGKLPGMLVAIMRRGELAYAETAIAHARLAGLPTERIVNCWPLEQLLEWSALRRGR